MNQLLMILAFGMTLTSGVGFAQDSFELEKNGKIYVCTEKTSDDSLNLAQLCRMAQTGNGETLYHANGRVFTYSAGNKGATWYYDDGKVITYSAGNIGSTWYYSNSRVLTYSSGTVGATWYYNNGQVISYSTGTAGATWYHKNGSVMTYSGPAMSAEELSYPCQFLE